MGEKPGYFENALSDFVYDMASGGAIRHLVDKGYSVDQIMGKLDYPTPRKRVEKTVYRYMTESGMLLSSLPVEEEEFNVHYVRNVTRRNLSEVLREHIRIDGEENSYMHCPFGEWMKNHRTDCLEKLSCLTSREREYILGLPWERNVMYHRLNSRMLEIGMELALSSDMELKFYFLKCRKSVVPIQ